MVWDGKAGSCCQPRTSKGDDVLPGTSLTDEKIHRRRWREYNPLPVVRALVISWVHRCNCFRRLSHSLVIGREVNRAGQRSSAGLAMGSQMCSLSLCARAALLASSTISRGSSSIMRAPPWPVGGVTPIEKPKVVMCCSLSTPRHEKERIARVLA
jgi:hypothetical protein